jgi:hypothetical protein
MWMNEELENEEEVAKCDKCGNFKSESVLWWINMSECSECNGKD